MRREEPHDTDVERERSANACHVAAGVLQALGEALGPENPDAATFTRWATEMQNHVARLRARCEDEDAPASLRVVRS